MTRRLKREPYRACKLIRHQYIQVKTKMKMVYTCQQSMIQCFMAFLYYVKMHLNTWNNDFTDLPRGCVWGKECLLTRYGVQCKFSATVAVTVSYSRMCIISSHSNQMVYFVNFIFVDVLVQFYPWCNLVYTKSKENIEFTWVR